MFSNSDYFPKDFSARSHLFARCSLNKSYDVNILSNKVVPVNLKQINPPNKSFR